MYEVELETKGGSQFAECPQIRTDLRKQIINIYLIYQRILLIFFFLNDRKELFYLI